MSEPNFVARGIDFRYNAKIYVDTAGKLYYLENDSSRQYFSDALNVNVGTTTTLPAGSDAYVVQTGTTNDVVLNFGLVAGNIGPVGPIGATGSTGPHGDVLYVGDTGPTGINGIQGVTGATGINGIQGVKGIKGDLGPVGPDGQKGPTGPKGDIGQIGPDGQ